MKSYVKEVDKHGGKVRDIFVLWSPRNWHTSDGLLHLLMSCLSHQIPFTACKGLFHVRDYAEKVMFNKMVWITSYKVLQVLS